MAGYLIYVNGSLVMWKSKMQESVTLSSTEAEYVAVSQCVTDMLFAKAVAESMNLTVKTPMTAYTDNTGAIDLLYNWTTAGRTRHISIRHHFMRELAERGIFELKHKMTHHNRADLMTKNLAEGPLRTHSTNLPVPPDHEDLGRMLENE